MDILLTTLEKARAGNAREDITELLARAHYLKSQIRRYPEKTLELILVARQLAAKGNFLVAASCMGAASMAALRLRKLAKPSANELATETALEWGTLIDQAIAREGLSPRFRNAIIKSTVGDAPADSPLAIQAKLRQADSVVGDGTGQGEQIAVPNTEAMPVLQAAATAPPRTIRHLRAMERPVSGQEVISAAASSDLIPPLLTKAIPARVPTLSAASIQPSASPPTVERTVVSEPVTNASRRGTVEISEFAPPVSPTPPPPSPDQTNKTAKPSPDVLNKMKVAAKWVAQRAPAFLTGAVAGGLLRAGGNLLVTNFVVAGLVATSPALASVAALASAAAVGVVAGGVANIVKTSIWGTAEEKQGNWKRAAFKKGWKWGALGGLAGFIAVDHFQGGAVLKNLYSPLKDLFSSGTPLPPAILPVAVPLLSHGAAQSAAQAAHVAHAAVFHPMPNTAPFGVDQILTPEEIVRHHISPELVKMMSSKDPETLMRACKEVSYHLINDAPTNPAKGVEFLQRGVHIFIESNPHTRGMVNLAHQMYADLAFEKYKVFLKTGDANARDTSLALAKLAHHAVHDYQGRLVEELHKAVTPKPATVVKLSLVPKSAMVQKPSMATNLSWMSKPPLALAA